MLYTDKGAGPRSSRIIGWCVDENVPIAGERLYSHKFRHFILELTPVRQQLAYFSFLIR